VKLVKEWEGKGNGRITTVLAPLAPDMTTAETYLRCTEAASKLGKPITTHIAQSTQEVRQVKKLYKKTSVEHLRDLGVLGTNTSGAHLIFATDSDIEILQRTATKILHCPRSYLLSGITAPLKKWHDKGLTIGLGTDNVFHSMLDTIRSALYAARITARSSWLPSEWPSLFDLLRFATIEGAKAIGLEKEIGSVEVGKKADIIIVNLQTPEITPTIDPVASTLLYANGNDIETVIIDGRIVKDHGRFRTVQEKKALVAAQRRSDAIWGNFWEAHPQLYKTWNKQTGTNYQ
jgi:5-methylthioadenosine/S-adenosylhomocysteine deaminase